MDRRLTVYVHQKKTVALALWYVWCEDERVFGRCWTESLNVSLLWICVTVVGCEELASILHRTLATNDYVIYSFTTIWKPLLRIWNNSKQLLKASASSPLWPPVTSPRKELTKRSVALSWQLIVEWSVVEDWWMYPGTWWTFAYHS